MRRISHPFPGNRSRRGRPRKVLSVFSPFLFLAALLVAVPLTVFSSTPANAASVFSTPFITWNMQGGTSLGESLWSSFLPG